MEVEAVMTVQVEIKDGLLVQPMPDFKDGHYEIKISSLDTRTLAQNRALWLWLTMIAHKLNNDNVPLTQVIKADVHWNAEKVKNMFIDPVIDAQFKVKSTTKLLKKDIDLLIDIMTKAFGSRGVELPIFPSVQIKEKQCDS